MDSAARVELRSTQNLPLLEKTFTIINRSLRVRNVPDHITVGSQLMRLEIEAVDENGEVDLTMSGKDHILTLDWDRCIIVPLLQGRCTLQGITMPLTKGKWQGCVFHTHYPNLRTDIKVCLQKSNQMKYPYVRAWHCIYCIVSYCFYVNLKIVSSNNSLSYTKFEMLLLSGERSKKGQK